MWKLSQRSNHEVLRSQHLDTMITFALQLPKVNKYMNHAKKKIAVLLAYNKITVFRVQYLYIILPEKSYHRYSLSFHKEIWAPYGSVDDIGTYLQLLSPCWPWGNW